MTISSGRLRPIWRGAPRSLTRGRRSTPVEVVLQPLVVKRLYGWNYAQTEHFVGDSLVSRQFCRVHLAPVPDGTTLIRWPTSSSRPVWSG